MTEGNDAPNIELEDILKRLDGAKDVLVKALDEIPDVPFDASDDEGESIKTSLERTVDDINFYYGRLAAKALNLPQPPCLGRASFGSLREGVMALQVAHRRFSNLLHDLQPGDLEKVGAEAELGSYTLRQILELASAQYRMRTQQVQRLASHAQAG